jgi:hypothetical protein
MHVGKCEQHLPTPTKPRPGFNGCTKSRCGRASGAYGIGNQAERLIDGAASGQEIDNAAFDAQSHGPHSWLQVVASDSA